MIRVIHVIPFPDGGGAEKLVRELVDKLPGYGVGSYAIYFQNPRGASLTEKEVCLGLSSIRSVKALSLLPDAIRSLSLKKQITIVHSHTTIPFFYIGLLSNSMCYYKVFTEHNTYNRRRSSRFFRLLERFFYSRYCKVFCISRPTKESLTNWLSVVDRDDRFSVIQNGSRMLDFYSRSPPKGRGVRVISVGSLSHQKGFDIALEAVYKVRDSIDSYTIVGYGPEENKLIKMVEKLGLQDVVRLVGYQDNVEPFFQEADLGLIPSRWEGFGLVSIEALSTGLPLVATDAPGLADVLDNCAAVKLVKRECATSLSDGIMYAIKNLVGHDAIPITARQRAEEYTIDKMVAQYAEAYKDLAGVDRALK